MPISCDFTDKTKWNQFIINNTRPASFLQSYEWGEFNQIKLNSPIKRVAIINQDELDLAGTLIKKPIGFGRGFWYCPRGFVWKANRLSRIDADYFEIVRAIRRLSDRQIFFRINPPYELKSYTEKFIQKAKLIPPKILTHLKEPDQTAILDLNKTEEELLANMHAKTRYNLRLAQKKGITIRRSNEKNLTDDINHFCRLMEQTARRDRVRFYPKDYYQKLIAFFSKPHQDCACRLYLAEYQHQPLAAIIVFYFGATATYLHGASANERRELMPNYLIQWRAILDAKQAGMAIYDFWGISQSNPDWAGITRFKTGFGGRPIRFIGAWDYVFEQKWYNLFRIMRIAKKIII